MSETQPIELDPGTPEIDLSQVKSRSLTGVIALTSRTFLVQIISFAATFLLTVFLSPADYGTFFLVSAVVNFLTYFSDIGLAAALIQKKEKIQRSDLVTTFTIQQCLVIFLLFLLFSFSPWIKQTYQLSSAAVYLMWALGISLFLSSLKTIPSVLLERELAFNKLVLPQILENIAFNITAVYFAWRGWGINAFTIAVLLRGVVGLIAMYIIAPWQISLGVDKKTLSHLLKFGLPYQANTFLAVIKDDGMTIVLGKLIGQTGLGYIGWASRWAYLPLRFFMDNVTKVAFPAYARVQHDTQALKKGIEKTLFYLSLISFPIFMGMGVMATPLVNLIPRYQKWLPALLPLYLYLINAVWASLSTPLTNALNAIGKIKITFKLMIMWTVLTWALMPFLGLKFGFLGVALAASTISFSSIIVLIVIKKYVDVDYFKVLKSPILGSLGMGVSLYFFTPFFTSLYLIPAYVLAGALVYLVIVYLIEGKALITDLQKLMLHKKRETH